MNNCTTFRWYSQFKRWHSAAIENNVLCNKLNDTLPIFCNYVIFIESPTGLYWSSADHRDWQRQIVSGLKYTLCNQCCLSNGVEVICTTGQLVPLFPNTLDRINCIYRLFMGGGGGMLRDSCQKNRAISKNKKPIMHTSTCLLELLSRFYLAC